MELSGSIQMVQIYPDIANYVQFCPTVWFCPDVGEAMIRRHPSLPSLASPATSRVTFHGNHRHYVMILTPTLGGTVTEKFTRSIVTVIKP
jgi:hypothetical protein